MKSRLLALIFLILTTVTLSSESIKDSISYKLTFIKLHKRKMSKAFAQLKLLEGDNSNKIVFNDSLLDVIYENIEFYVDIEETERRDKLVYPFVFTGKIGERLEYSETIDNRSTDIQQYIKINLTPARGDVQQNIITKVFLDIKSEEGEFSSSQTVILSKEYTPIAIVEGKFDAGSDSESYHLLVAKYSDKNLDISKDSFVFEEYSDKWNFMEMDTRPELDNNISMAYSFDENYELGMSYGNKSVLFDVELAYLDKTKGEVKLSSVRKEYFNYALKYSLYYEKLSIGLMDELKFVKLSLSSELYYSRNESKSFFDFIFALGYELEYFDVHYEKEFKQPNRDIVILDLFPDKKYSTFLKYSSSEIEEKILLGLKYNF